MQYSKLRDQCCYHIALKLKYSQCQIHTFAFSLFRTSNSVISDVCDYNLLNVTIWGLKGWTEGKCLYKTL